MGDLEHLVLLAILRLGSAAYGVPIAEEVEARTGRSVSQASVYLALRRLEHKGWVASHLGDPTAERGGRAKRYFAVTGVGMDHLHSARSELLAMWDGLAGVWES